MSTTPRIVVTELRKTCDACPSQWEGRTADGRHIYIRYRFGDLSFGTGESFESAVRDSMNRPEQWLALTFREPWIMAFGDEITKNQWMTDVVTRDAWRRAWERERR